MNFPTKILSAIFALSFLNYVTTDKKKKLNQNATLSRWLLKYAENNIKDPLKNGFIAQMKDDDMPDCMNILDVVNALKKSEYEWTITDGKFKDCKFYLGLRYGVAGGNMANVIFMLIGISDIVGVNIYAEKLPPVKKWWFF